MGYLYSFVVIVTPYQAVKDGSMCAAALSLPVVLDYLTMYALGPSHPH